MRFKGRTGVYQFVSGPSDITIISQRSHPKQYLADEKKFDIPVFTCMGMTAGINH
jgi:hypothetical protein